MGSKTYDYIIADQNIIPESHKKNYTEDVLYMLHGSNIETGVNMEKILEASKYIDSILNRKSTSKVCISKNISLN